MIRVIFIIQRFFLGTNIFDAVNEGLKVLDSNSAKTLTSMMLFLTDGQPTVGETNGTVINEKITKLNTKRDIINSIGFGNDADILLMRRISANNKGLAKKVYEDSDAAIQLTGKSGLTSVHIVQYCNVLNL